MKTKGLDLGHAVLHEMTPDVISPGEIRETLLCVLFPVLRVQAERPTEGKGEASFSS